MSATENDDTLTGTSGADTIDGLGGNDTISGGDGNDILSGGSGNDTVNGDNGDDTINGNDGDDTLAGGAGADTIDGGDGADIINGDDGNDTLIGGAGNDVINGGAGDDVVQFSGSQSDYEVIDNGNGTFTVNDLNVADGDGGSDTISNTETIEFLGSNTSFAITDGDPPVTSVSRIAVPVDGTAEHFLEGAGPNGTAQGFVLVDGPENGFLSLGADGQYVFRANAGFTGFDHFSYKFRDSNGVEQHATASVAVGGAEAELSAVDLNFGGERLSYDPASFLPSGVSGNSSKWTISTWIKTTGFNQTIFAAESADGTKKFNFFVNFQGRLQAVEDVGTPTLNVQQSNSGPLNTPVNDGEWHHVMLRYNIGQGDNSAELFLDGRKVNGGLQTRPNSDSIVGQRGVNHFVGGSITVNGSVGPTTFNGQMADFHFVDGQDLPKVGGFNDDFSVADGTARVPRLYEGPYGNGGFHLDFENPNDLGKDVSGNNNDVVPNQKVDSADHISNTDLSINAHNGTESADAIVGDAGANTINGNAGDDLLIGGAGGDTINGGAGTDTVSYEDSSAGVLIDLDARTSSGGDAQGDVLTNIENIIGSAHADTITGNSGNNFLDGGSGNDTLNGGAGDDTIQGGEGDDTIDVGSGNNTVIFRGNENDFTVSTVGNVTTVTDTNTSDGDEGTDTITGTHTRVFIVPDAGPPVVTNPSLTISEGETKVITVADLGVSDPDDANVDIIVDVSNVTGGQFEKVSEPSIWKTWFNLESVANGEIRFVHDGGEAAPTFSVKATDASGASSGDPVAALIDFTNVEEAPIAGNDTFTARSDGDFVITFNSLLANDVDPEGGALTIDSFTNVTGATLTQFDIDGDGTNDSVFLTNLTGSGASFDYTISDIVNLTDTASVAVNIDDTVNAPEVRAGKIVLPVNNANVEHTLFGTDADGDALTFTLVADGDDVLDTSGANPILTIKDGVTTVGTVELTDASTGAYTFDPDNGFTGAETFTYRVTDSTGLTTTAEMQIDIHDVAANPLVSIAQTEGTAIGDMSEHNSSIANAFNSVTNLAPGGSGENIARKDASTGFVGKQYSTPKKVLAVDVTSPNNSAGFVYFSTGNVTLTLRWSDDGVNWTDVGSETFAEISNQTTITVEAASDPGAHAYWSVKIDGSTGLYIDEVVFFENALDDVVGLSGNDILKGSTIADLIVGNDGDDILEGGAGDDTIDGGAGHDVAVFSGNRADYDVTRNEDGSFTVNDTLVTGGDDGTDSITNTEFLRFDGDDVTLDLTSAGKIVLPANNANVRHNLAASETMVGPSSFTLDGADSNGLLTITGVGTVQLVDGTGSAVSSNGDGAYVFNPDDTFTGQDSFTYQVTDSAGLTTTAEMNITIGETAASLSGLRFDGNDGLSFTPSAAGTSATTWTLSAWINPTDLGGSTPETQTVFGYNPGPGKRFSIDVIDGNKLRVHDLGHTGMILTTGAVLTSGSMQHISVTVDTTQATESHRVVVSLDGVAISSFDTGSVFPAKDAITGATEAGLHTIGRYGSGSNHFDGSIADIQFIDGVALQADTFGTFQGTDWIHRDFTNPPGGYGNAGFHIDFSDPANPETDVTGTQTVSTIGSPVHLTDASVPVFTSNLNGLTGNDILVGDDSDDVITGNDGDDLLEGGGGNDTIDGGAGDDILVAGDGVDLSMVPTGIIAGETNVAIGSTVSASSIKDGVVSNIVDGELNFTSTNSASLGNDTLGNAVNGVGFWQLDFGAPTSFDTIRFSQGQASNFRWVGSVVIQVSDDGVIWDNTSTESVIPGANTITFGTQQSRYVRLLADSAVLDPNGNVWPDTWIMNEIEIYETLDETQTEKLGSTLSGGIGDDTLIGGTGNDVLDGGADTGSVEGDIAVYTGVRDDYTIEDNDDGTFTVTDTDAVTDGDDGTDIISNVETVRFSDADVAIVGSGPEARAGKIVLPENNANVEHTLFGTDADGDTLTFTLDGATNGLLTITGVGTVQLVDGTGSAVSSNGHGAYVFNPDDVFTGQDSFTYRVTDSTGLTTTADMAIDISEAVPASLVGLAGNDILVGDDSDDVITGNDGDDLLEGGGGNDTIDGGAGDDILVAGDGVDLSMVPTGIIAGETNVAIGSTVSASSIKDGVVSNIVDGELNFTSTNSASLGNDTLGNAVNGVGFWQLDFGAPTSFDTIRFSQGQASNFRWVGSVVIQVSDDGVIWDNTSTESVIPGANTITFGTQQSRYVRLLADSAVLDPNGNVWPDTWIMNEIEIYETLDETQTEKLGSTLSGGIGDDTLIGGTGNDVLDGGADTGSVEGDIAVYTGVRDDYTIEDNGDGTFTVTDTDAIAAGDDGTDIISNVETLRFSSGDMAVTGSGPEARAGRIVLPLNNANVEHNLFGTDADADELAFTLEDADSNGLLTITGVGTVQLVDGTGSAVSNNGDGAYVFNPDDTFTGQDSFTYRVTDSTGLTTTAEMQIDVGFEISASAFSELDSSVPGGNTGTIGLNGLTFTGNSTSLSSTAVGDLPVSSGKFYFEVFLDNYGQGYPHVGLTTEASDSALAATSGSREIGTNNIPDSLSFHNGVIIFNNVTLASGLTVVSTGDVVGVEVDASTNSVAFFVNNTLEATVDVSFVGSELTPAISAFNSRSGTFRFAPDEQSFARNASEFASLNTDSVVSGVATPIEALIEGLAGNDVLTGTDGANTLVGNDGDDLLEGGAGDDVINGGAGDDVAVFSGAQSDYTIEDNGDGTFTVTDTDAVTDGDDGTDIISNIETVRFSDADVAIVGSGPEARAGKIVLPENNANVEHTLFGTDADADELAFTLEDADSNGLLTITGVGTVQLVDGTGSAVSNNGDGAYVFNPDDTFTGQDSFTYRVTDSTGLTTTAEMAIEIGQNLSQPTPQLVATGVDINLDSPSGPNDEFAVADIDGDGNLDLIAVDNIGRRGLKTIFGTSSGFFGDIVADVDIADWQAGADQQNGTSDDIGFELVHTFSTTNGQQPVTLAAAMDLTGDGAAEIFTAHSQYRSQHEIYEGGSALDATVDLTLQNPIPGNGLKGANSVGVGDFNGDGLADIFVGSSGSTTGGSFAATSPTLSGWLGQAGATSASQALTATPTVTGHANLAGIGLSSKAMQSNVLGLVDINGDGFDDVVTTAGMRNDLQFSQLGHVKVTFGNAAGTFESDLSSSTGGFLISGFSTDWEFRNLANYAPGTSGDVNGDGMLDAAFWEQGTSSADILFGSSSFSGPIDLSNMGVQTGLSVTVTGSEISSVSIGDVDGDGLSDIVLGTPELETDKGGFWVVRGQKNGWSSSSLTLDASTTTNDIAFFVSGDTGGASEGIGATIQIGDLNNDGFNDVIAGTTNDFGASLDDGNVYVFDGLSVAQAIDGTQGNDILVGGNGDDVIAGKEGSDRLDGGAGNDILYGGTGDDTLEGGIGDDTINGGAGDDVAVFAGAQSDYTIEDNGDGTFTVTDTDAVTDGDDGTDIVSDIETLRFSSGDFTIAGSGPEVRAGRIVLPVNNANVEHTLFGTDADVDTLTFTLDGADSNGLLTITGVGTVQLVDGTGSAVSSNGDGVYVFNPDDTFTGQENFTYRVTDSTGLTTTAQMSIDIDSLESIVGTIGNDVLTGEAGTEVGVSDIATAGQAIGVAHLFNDDPSKAFDDNSSTKFTPSTAFNGNSGNETDAWVGQAFTEAKVIGSIEIDTSPQSDEFADTVVVETASSVNGPWTEVASFANGAANSTFQVDIPDTVAAATHWRLRPSVETAIVGTGIWKPVEIRMFEVTVVPVTLSGGDGDDLLQGSTSDDTMDGGDGDDIAVFAGVQSDYTIEDNGDGTFTVTDTDAVTDGDDGTDIISNVETVRFSDTDVAIVGSGPEARAGRIVLPVNNANVEHTLFGTDADGNGLTFTLVADGDNTLNTSGANPVLTVMDGAVTVGTVELTDATTGAYIFNPDDAYSGTETFTYRVTDSTGLSQTTSVDLQVGLEVDPFTSAYSTLSATDKHSGVVVSGDGLEGNAGSFHQAVRSTHGVSSGKWYYEVRQNNFGAYAYGGFATSEVPLSANYPGPSNNYTDGYQGGYWAALNNGTRFVGANGITTGLTNVYTNSVKTFGFALDLDNNKVYVSYDGVWQLGANPGANSGGFAIDPDDIGKTFYAIYSGGDAGSFDRPFSMNFGAGDTGPLFDTQTLTLDAASGGTFEHTPPQGFLAINEGNIENIEGVTLIGNTGNDILVGDDGDNNIEGNDGDDLLEGGGGSDTIDGGAGNDIAVFAGAQSDYTIEDNGDGTFTVTDTDAVTDGDDGTDIISNTETVRFQNGNEDSSDDTDVAIVGSGPEARAGRIVLPVNNANVEHTLFGTDADADDLAFTLEGADSNGLLTITGVGTVQLVDGTGSAVSSNTDGAYVFNPDDAFSGTDNFTYRVTDSTGLTTTAEMEVIASDLAVPATGDHAIWDNTAGGTLTFSDEDRSIATSASGHQRAFSALTTGIASSGTPPTEGLPIYAEMTHNGHVVGFGVSSGTTGTTFMGSDSNSWGLYDNNEFVYLRNNGTGPSIRSSMTASDVMQVAYDPATGNLWLGINDTWYNSTGGTTGDPAAGLNPTFTNIPLDVGLAASVLGIATATVVPAEADWTFNPPAGFVSFNTTNLNGTPAIAEYTGISSNDILVGGDAADTIIGEDGDDTLNGGAGDDTLIGGTGDDLITTGSGSDTVQFSAGDGADTITDAGFDALSTDTLDFAGALTSNSLWLAQVGDDLRVDLLGATDSVTLQGWFATGATAADRMDRIESGGEVLVEGNVQSLVNAMATWSAANGGQDGDDLNEMPDDTTLSAALTTAWQAG